MFEWRAASGDAHARLWPRSFRPGVAVPIIGERAKVKTTTGTTETYGVSLGAATMATSHALRLWDEQRKAPQDVAHGADAADAAQRSAAIDETAGTADDVFESDFVERLRADWPD